MPPIRSASSACSTARSSLKIKQPSLCSQRHPVDLFAHCAFCWFLGAKVPLPLFHPLLTFCSHVTKFPHQRLEKYVALQVIYPHQYFLSLRWHHRGNAHHPLSEP